jgi:hypothetical protein
VEGIPWDPQEQRMELWGNSERHHRGCPAMVLGIVRHKPPQAVCRYSCGCRYLHAIYVQSIPVFLCKSTLQALPAPHTPCSSPSELAFGSPRSTQRGMVRSRRLERGRLPSIDRRLQQQLNTTAAPGPSQPQPAQPISSTTNSSSPDVGGASPAPAPGPGPGLPPPGCLQDPAGLNCTGARRLQAAAVASAACQLLRAFFGMRWGASCHGA